MSYLKFSFYKALAICLFTSCLFTSCEEEECASCVAQSRVDKTIIETRVACDKSDSFLAGFRDGFRSNYKDKLNDVEVICN